MVISASLQACGVVFPLAMLTSICRSIATICSGLYLLMGMTRFSSKWILSHSTWYKFRRSRHQWSQVSGFSEHRTCDVTCSRMKGLTSVGEWLSLVEHLVRDQGVGGSNPLSPTIYRINKLRDFSLCWKVWHKGSILTRKAKRAQVSLITF